MTADDAQALAAFEQFVTRFNSVSVSDWLSELPADFEVRTADVWPGGGTFSGVDEVGRLMAEFSEAWEAIRYEATEPRVVDGFVVHRAAWAGRGRSFDVETRVSFVGAFRIDDGRVTGIYLFESFAEAIEFVRARS